MSAALAMPPDVALSIAIAPRHRRPALGIVIPPAGPSREELTPPPEACDPSPREAACVVDVYMRHPAGTSHKVPAGPMTWEQVQAAEAAAEPWAAIGARLAASPVTTGAPWVGVARGPRPLPCAACASILVLVAGRLVPMAGAMCFVCGVATGGVVASEARRVEARVAMRDRLLELCRSGDRGVEWAALLARCPADIREAIERRIAAVPAAI